MNGFIEKLVDWQEFEKFVQSLYQEPGTDISAVHNLTETGKSGARRQIDVKVTVKTRLHTLTVIVECKRWKDPVDRSRIDILAATIDDLGAAKGVMFTTSGFEEGAVAYARAKNIDLFLVRDLSPEEWGLPGRHIRFYLHTVFLQVQNLAIPNAQFIPMNGQSLSHLDINLVVDSTKPLDEAFRLYSKSGGEAGPHLIELFQTCCSNAAMQMVQSIGLISEGTSGATVFRRGLIKIVLTPEYEYSLLKIPQGLVKLGDISMTLLVQVHQALIEHDRGAPFDFALAVENYISGQKKFATKNISDAVVALSDPIQPQEPKSDVLKNDSIIRVFMSLGVGVNIPADAKIEESAPMTVTVNAPPPQKCNVTNKPIPELKGLQ